MALKILYEHGTLLVVDKPAGYAVWPEPNQRENEVTVADLLLAQFPYLKELGEELRYGIVHRLDKETSGVLLIAKTREAFEFFQKQFKERSTEKRYLCLVVGTIKTEEGIIDAPLGRSPADRRKQKAYRKEEVGGKNIREAQTSYRVIQRYRDYTLLEVAPKTGRKHQIRAHLAFLHHPIALDTLYGFKNQPAPPGLTRQFLHASYLNIHLPDGSQKEFHSPLPSDLTAILETLRTQ